MVRMESQGDQRFYRVSCEAKSEKICRIRQLRITMLISIKCKHCGHLSHSFDLGVDLSAECLHCEAPLISVDYGAGHIMIQPSEFKEIRVLDRTDGEITFNCVDIPKGLSFLYDSEYIWVGTVEQFDNAHDIVDIVNDIDGDESEPDERV